MSVCVLDIETNGLEGDRAQLLLATVYDPATGKYFCFRTWDRSHRRTTTLERRALAGLFRRLTRYDLVVTYYGTRFDLPFLRTRSLYYGRRTPKLSAHVDLYYIVRWQLRLSSNSLANVTRLARMKETKLRLPREVLDQSPFIRPVVQRALQRRCVSDTRLTWQLATSLVRVLNSDGRAFQALRKAVRETGTRKSRKMKRLCVPGSHSSSKPLPRTAGA